MAKSSSKPSMVSLGRPIQVTTPDGVLSLTIQLELEAGSDRRVYKVKDQRGLFFVYKHCKKRSAKKEVERTQQTALLGVPYAKMIAHGENFIVREWVEGIRGDDWLKSWESFGAPMDVPGAKDLVLLMDSCARQGVYVGKLDPADMVLSGDRWHIVDSGGIKRMTPREAADRYFWKTLERWGGLLDRFRSGFPHLMELLLLLGKDYPLDEVLPPMQELLPPVPAPSPAKSTLKSSKKRDEDEDDEEDDPASGGTSDDEDDEEDDEDEDDPADGGTSDDEDDEDDEEDEDDEDDEEDEDDEDDEEDEDDEDEEEYMDEVPASPASSGTPYNPSSQGGGGQG